MLIYRVKYTESESDIQFYNFFYKSTNNAKILSNFWKNVKKYIFSKILNFHYVICISCIIPFLCFWKFWDFWDLCIFRFLYFYIFIFLSINHIHHWWLVVVGGAHAAAHHVRLGRSMPTMQTRKV